MTVQQLIERLQQHRPDMKVAIGTNELLVVQTQRVLLVSEDEPETVVQLDCFGVLLLQALLFDLWRDGVLSEQQCAKYHEVDLVSMRRIFACEAALRGLKDREDERQSNETITPDSVG